MPDVDPRKLAQSERVLIWSLRSCITSLVVTISALVLALADMGGGDQTILSAIGLFVCFVGVFFALTGLFGLALARETPRLRPAPSWIVSASVGAIVANFVIAFFGMRT